MRISDWSSDVCSSDLVAAIAACPCSSIDRRPQYRVGLHGLGDQRRIIGNVAIPFDEHGLRAGSIEKTRQQVPATRAHRRSMVVDRDGAAHIVLLARMARNADFADKPRDEGLEPRPRTEPEIKGRNLDIADLAQPATADRQRTRLNPSP